MIVDKSILILNDFIILNSKVKSIPFEKEQEFSFRECQSNYPIDIDYSIDELEDEDTFVIYCKVIINPEEKSGYSIYAEGVGFFGFDKGNDLSDAQKVNFANLSALSICITNLRSYVATATSFYPYGKFNFASIDVNDLIKKKMELIVENSEKNKSN